MPTAIMNELTESFPPNCESQQRGLTASDHKSSSISAATTNLSVCRVIVSHVHTDDIEVTGQVSVESLSSLSTAGLPPLIRQAADDESYESFACGSNEPGKDSQHESRVATGNRNDPTAP